MHRFVLMALIVSSSLGPPQANAGANEDARRRLALGRHLASECAVCHRTDASSPTIPSIVGRTPAEFIATLKLYAAGRRADGGAANATMVSVAQSLDEEQMAALAAYFASQTPPTSPASGTTDR